MAESKIQGVISVQLTEKAIKEIATCVMACSRSGGGSYRYDLVRLFEDLLGEQIESSEVVKAQVIVARGLLEGM